MSDLKVKAQGIESSVQARDMSLLVGNLGSIYESIAIVSHRAKQLSVQMKRELHSKLEEFATHTETIDEILENKEQIEISKFYERLPNTTLIATEEFLEGELEWRHKNAKKEEEENV